MQNFINDKRLFTDGQVFELRHRIQFMDDYEKKNYHQCLLNVVYNDWQTVDRAAQILSRPELSWGYDDALNNAVKKYGPITKLATLIGKYNQQVGNGGHFQYFDNGYANEGGGCMSNHDPDELILHQDMIDSMEECKDLFDCCPQYHPVLEIMKRFQPEVDTEAYDECECYNCNGSGTVSREDEEDEDAGEWEDQCDDCDGTGYEQCENENRGMLLNQSCLDQLDKEYYQVMEGWMNCLNEIFGKVLNQIVKPVKI